MPSTPSASDQVNWFRNSSPYINAHRGRTFVVLLGGEVLDTPRLPTLVHDLALLNALGVKLVLVHGARPQISQRLEAAGLESRFEHHTRITDSNALEAVMAAVGALRLKLEGLFSMGLANSPMHNAAIQLISGNFVIAKPVGVRNGFDYQHTGEVRRIEVDAIRQQMDAGNVVLLSPLGSSPTGELFNLNAEDVASTAAIPQPSYRDGAHMNSARDRRSHFSDSDTPTITSARPIRSLPSAKCRSRRTWSSSPRPTSFSFSSGYSPSRPAKASTSTSIPLV